MASKDKHKKQVSLLDRLFDQVTQAVFHICRSFAKLASTTSGSTILKLCGKVLVLLLFVFLLQFPFFLLNQLGQVLFRLFPTFVSGTLLPIWSLLIQLFYVIAGLLLSHHILSRMVLEEKKQKMKQEQYALQLLPPVLQFIRIFLIILSIPIAILGLLAFLGLIFLVACIFQGAYLISFFSILVGLLLMIGSVLFVVVRCIRHKGGC